MSTSFSYSDTTPIMMGQVDAEEGMAGPPAAGFTGGPATGYAGPSATGLAGGSVWRQEPTADANFSSADLRAMHTKSDRSLILSIVSFIGCFFCTFMCCPFVSMICHIPAMLFAAKSRVLAEKKDYYESKAMLHWSYILTFAGCFLGGVLLGVIVVSLITLAIIFR